MNQLYRGIIRCILAYCQGVAKVYRVLIQTLLVGLMSICIQFLRAREKIHTDLEG